MAAGHGTLEELVEELRPAIRDLVGRLVVGFGLQIVAAWP
jgi:hypothetical protein